MEKNVERKNHSPIRQVSPILIPGNSPDAHISRSLERLNTFPITSALTPSHWHFLDVAILDPPVLTITLKSETNKQKTGNLC